MDKFPSSAIKNSFVNKSYFLIFSGGGSTLDPNGRPFAGSHKSQMIRQQAMLTGQNGLLPESVIWTYVIQMTSALRHIHSAGLACRTLDPTKILIINKTRLLLNCCGIFDVLTFDPTSSNPMAAMAHYQQEDLIALGKIVLGNVIQITTREFLFRACKNIEVLSDFFFFWNLQGISLPRRISLKGGI